MVNVKNKFDTLLEKSEALTPNDEYKNSSRMFTKQTKNQT